VGFLTDLVALLRADLDARPLDRATLVVAAAAQPAPRAFATAIASHPAPAVIAEVKRASPSAGAIAVDADPIDQATRYAGGGAAAISVLTEPTHFRGSLDDLRAVRGAVALPLLRKDFIVCEEQILEARAAGADSVLLITSCLADEELAELLGAARDLGMEPLVETHDDDDLARALRTDAAVIGVNARNLETLEVDVGAALARIARVPADRVAVLESGVRTPSDVAAALEAGASAVLVGEALMRADDPATAVRELRGARADAPPGQRPKRQEEPA
jgi:indole-3-glycerol phosphate synthase